MRNAFGNNIEYILIGTAAGRIDRGDGHNLDVQSMSVVRATGQGAGPHRLFQDSFSSGHLGGKPLNSIYDNIGEWLVVAEDESSSQAKYVVVADPFGYCPAFYTIIPGIGIAISDSFYGAVQARRNYNANTTLDLTNYIVTMSSNQPFFDNPTAYRTMATEIKILGIDEILVVDEVYAGLAPRSEITPPNLSDYDSQIELGIEFSSETLNTLVESGPRDNVLYLSGGVDSRLILALLKYSGLHEQFQISSVDPRLYKPGYSQDIVTRDIEIADEIRRDLGMKWWGVATKVSIPFSFRDSLFAFQSFSSNFSYSFDPQSSKTVFEKQYLALRGGGGEILRSTNTAETLSERISSSSASPVKNVALFLAQQTPVGSSVSDYIVGLFLDAYGNKRHENERQFINFHYLNARNRTHFGHTRFSNSGNELAFHPLSNVYFRSAAEALSTLSREQGQLTLDIFRRSSPSLLDFRFENRYWDGQLASCNARPRPSEGAWISGYDESKNEPALVKRRWISKSGSRAGRSKFDAKTASLNFLKMALSRIEEHAPSSSGDTLPSLHQSILVGIGQGKLNIFRTSAKAASALDVFVPPVSAAKEVVIGNPLSTAQASEADLKLQFSPPATPQDGWNNIAIIELDPRMSVIGESILAEAFDTPNFSVGIEFAFYLKKGGNRVATRWYEPKPFAVFAIDGPGTFTLQCFAKAAGSSAPFQIETVSRTFSELGGTEMNGAE